MNTRRFFSISTLIFLASFFFACNKTEEIVTPPVVKQGPVIPSGDRIIIHFGTSTQTGCMYSFSNCIWIGWGASAINYEGRLALQFDNGDKAGQYFGQLFPLTSDYTVTEAEAQALGIAPQVIPAGFYKMRDISTGQATGKRIVVFDPAQGQATGSLLNPNNPQDNIGQLHNLSVQVILNDNSEALAALNGDKAGIQKLVAEKAIKFLAEAELPVNATDQERAFAADLNQDFGDYTARLNASSLSANDKKAVQTVFDGAATIPVNSPESLRKFILYMTEQENHLANGTQLDNPTVVLSMVSVLKNSRYFWYWKSLSAPTGGSTGTDASRIPDWVWADVIGMELGGPIVSALASTAVYLDQR